MRPHWVIWIRPVGSRCWTIERVELSEEAAYAMAEFYVEQTPHPNGFIVDVAVTTAMLPFPAKKADQKPELFDL